MFGIAGIRLPGQGAVFDLCFVRGRRRDGEPHPSASPPRQESWDTPSACGGHPMTKDTPSACGGHPMTSPKRGRQHGLPPAFSRGTGFRPPFRVVQASACPSMSMGCRPSFRRHGLPPVFRPASAADVFTGERSFPYRKKRSALLHVGERGSFFVCADMRGTAAAVRGRHRSQGHNRLTARASDPGSLWAPGHSPWSVTRRCVRSRGI